MPDWPSTPYGPPRFAAQSDEGTTIDMLDAMQQLLTGDAKYFDPAFLEELLQVGSVENGL